MSLSVSGAERPPHERGPFTGPAGPGSLRPGNGQHEQEDQLPLSGRADDIHGEETEQGGVRRTGRGRSEADPCVQRCTQAP
jgi:hypothetical protein